MIERLWEQITAGNDVRQNLSKLRQKLRSDGRAAAEFSRKENLTDILTGFLKSEDAKTRKNTALLMGDLRNQDFLAPVFEAYLAEQQMFVKSSYLSAMKSFDCRKCMEQLKTRLDELLLMEPDEENQKHISEEMRELSALIVMTEGVRTHEFIGYDEKYNIVLLTNRNHQELTAEEILERAPTAEVKVFNSGVRAAVTGLHFAESIRTYQELLFMVKGMASCPMDAEKAAQVIVKSDLLSFLNRSHKGNPPYYFRVEIKSKMEPDKRMAFAKKLSDQLERLSGRALINTTSRYELEIRLVQNKEGNFNLLIKLYTLKDERFSYRKEAAAASIRPYNAALTAALTKDYMKEGAQVLDPFCGVGTMLIERHKAVRANTTYGLDIQAASIEKAKENTEAAHQIIHYINKDFFDFEHQYLFDEIITDMPFRIGRITEQEILTLYRRFFQFVPSVLKEDGIIILYSHDRAYVRQMAPAAGFRILKEYEISMKEGTYVFVLGRTAGGLQ